MRALSLFLWLPSSIFELVRIKSNQINQIIFQESGLKWVYKPGSVEDDHSSRRIVTNTLKQPTRIQRGPRQRIPIWSCFWWGLPCRDLLPDTRCALTAPFHPYRLAEASRRSALCCTFRRLSPPRRYLAPCPMKPGLSSPVLVLITSTAATVQLTSRRAW